jgi:hypothetical protein
MRKHKASSAFELKGLGWLSPSCVPVLCGELGRSVEFVEMTSSFDASVGASEGGIVDDIVCVLGVPWG